MHRLPILYHKLIIITTLTKNKAPEGALCCRSDNAYGVQKDFAGIAEGVDFVAGESVERGIGQVFQPAVFGLSHAKVCVQLVDFHLNVNDLVRFCGEPRDFLVGDDRDPLSNYLRNLYHRIG